MSTQFQHRRIHKETWPAPDHTTLNQIDHVLINSKKKDLIDDVRTMRGPNIDSDHFLKIIVNQNLPKIYLRIEPKLGHGINQISRIQLNFRNIEELFKQN